MSEYSKEHWDALVSIYENNGRTRVSAHEIGIIWADQHIKDLTKQLSGMREALVYYRDECSGREPSISTFQRMLDEALAALPPQEQPDE